MYIGLWLLSAGHISILLHPHCTPGPSPYVYKRKVQGPRTREVAAREDGLTDRLSLSLANACNPPTASASTLGAGQHEAVVFPLFVFRLAPTHLGWGMQR
jgi:hypothetical protein